MNVLVRNLETMMIEQDKKKKKTVLNSIIHFKHSKSQSFQRKIVFLLLEVPHRLEIRQFKNICGVANLTIQVGLVELI